MCKLAMTRKISLVAVVLIGAGVLVGPTAAKIQTTYIDLFNPLGLPNPLVPNQVGQVLDPGKIICPGHALTGNPAQPCPEDTRLVARGVRALNRIDSEDPAMAGWMTVDLNANLGPDYAGPVWGKLSIQLDVGGVWEGTWEGIRERVADQSIWTADIRLTLHGQGGNIDGMQAKCTEQITALTAMPVLYKGLGNCRLLQPGEK